MSDKLSGQVVSTTDSIGESLAGRDQATPRNNYRSDDEGTGKIWVGIRYIDVENCEYEDYTADDNIRREINVSDDLYVAIENYATISRRDRIADVDWIKALLTEPEAAPADVKAERDWLIGEILATLSDMGHMGPIADAVRIYTDTANLEGGPLLAKVGQLLQDNRGDIKYQCERAHRQMARDGREHKEYRTYVDLYYEEIVTDYVDKGAPLARNRILLRITDSTDGRRKLPGVDTIITVALCNLAEAISGRVYIV
jgi:hypothetical protein